MLGERRAARRVGGHLLRPRVRDEWRSREQRIGSSLALLALLHAGYYAAWMLSWLILGRAILSGYLEAGWVIAWALCIACAVPLRVAGSRATGRLGVRLGALLKRRLLVGSLRMPADEVRALGIGRLMGRAIEADVMESAALSGGAVALTATVELMFAAVVLGLGAAGALHVSSLAVSLVVLSAIGAVFVRRRARWMDARRELTHHAAERVLAHRTCAVQDRCGTEERRADVALAAYLGRGRDLDRMWLAVEVLPRAWLLLGWLTLAPQFVADAAAMGPIAVSLGGILLAHRALSALAHALEPISAVAVCWRSIRPFVDAAATPMRVGPPGLSSTDAGDLPRSRVPVLSARKLRQGYSGRAEAVLRDADIVIARGERVLLEGESGAGKSTLAAVLAGIRRPDAGVLLLDGLDPSMIGEEAWRRRVVLVPQFHENHVLMGSFAFNLLLGRGWPPTSQDLSDAQDVCRAMGLAPLLDRMPRGLDEMLGETGWQLSHGERTRLFAARAVLQNPSVAILDESFAALDPETLPTVVDAALDRLETSVVITHR